MKQFTLPLDRKRQRPTMFLERFYNLEVMLDTGAVLPVWTEEEKLLKGIGAELLIANQPFGGFGGITIGSLYRMPFFRCGDLVYPNMPIIASRSNLPCHMILSATMFNNLIYKVDNCHHMFNVSVPDTESVVRNLRVEDKEGSLHVLCTGVTCEV